MPDLQDRLLAAHASDDRAALVQLYAEAADRAADIDSACFFLTQAYVFALERGDPAVQPLFNRLKAQGRV